MTVVCGSIKDDLTNKHARGKLAKTLLTFHLTWKVSRKKVTRSHIGNTNSHCSYRMISIISLSTQFLGFKKWHLTVMLSTFVNGIENTSP